MWWDAGKSPSLISCQNRLQDLAVLPDLHKRSFSCSHSVRSQSVQRRKITEQAGAANGQEINRRWDRSALIAAARLILTGCKSKFPPLQPPLHTFLLIKFSFNVFLYVAQWPFAFTDLLLTPVSWMLFTQNAIWIPANYTHIKGKGKGVDVLWLSVCMSISLSL